jgi:hypothetical protein
MANQPLNEQQLQALLRLKKHEQPPPGYFDDLLQAVQRRQREEMLRRPAWRIMAERVSTFFSSMRQDWAYAGSMAGILLIGVGAIQMAMPRKVQLVTSKAQPPSGIVADGGQTAPQFQTVPFALGQPQRVTVGITPDPQRRGNPNLREVKTPRSGPPRYPIDTMPASYEQTQIRF